MVAKKYVTYGRKYDSSHLNIHIIKNDKSKTIYVGLISLYIHETLKAKKID